MVMGWIWRRAPDWRHVHLHRLQQLRLCLRWRSFLRLLASCSGVGCHRVDRSRNSETAGFKDFMSYKLSSHVENTGILLLQNVFFFLIASMKNLIAPLKNLVLLLTHWSSLWDPFLAPRSSTAWDSTPRSKSSSSTSSRSRQWLSTCRQISGMQLGMSSSRKIRCTKGGREVSFSTSIGMANTNIEIQTQIGRFSIPFNVNNIF